jgi:CRP/FNR family cyclic AMP-dependent transcriptional regulator
LGPGDVLGWSWLFPPFVWHFQARAVEPTTLLVLNGAGLLVSAERDHDFGYELMKRVAQVVIRRLQATRKQLLEQQVQSALEG